MDPHTNSNQAQVGIPFAHVVAGTHVRENEREPTATPYMLYGECLSLSGYFLQLGCLLADRHRAHPQEFLTAFLGTDLMANEVQEFIDTAYSRVLAPMIKPHSAFMDVIVLDQMDRLGYEGEPLGLFEVHGMEKVKSEAAVQMFLEYAQRGAVIGLADEDASRSLFRQQHAPVEPEVWEKARSEGLELPKEYVPARYDEVQQQEDSLFMDHLRVAYPSLRETLEK